MHPVGLYAQSQKMATVDALLKNPSFGRGQGIEDLGVRVSTAWQKLTPRSKLRAITASRLRYHFFKLKQRCFLTKPLAEHRAEPHIIAQRHCLCRNWRHRCARSPATSRS